MSAERARHILKRAGYAQGGELLRASGRQIEDAGDVSRQRAIDAGKRDRMVVPSDGDDPIEWQRTHPNPDPDTYSYSHLPSDLKQRDMLPAEIAGSKRGGVVRKKRAEGGVVDEDDDNPNDPLVLPSQVTHPPSKPTPPDRINVGVGGIRG